MAGFTKDEIRESPIYAAMLASRKRMSSSKRSASQNMISTTVWKYPHAIEKSYSSWIDEQFRNQIVRPVNNTVLSKYDIWKIEYRKDSSEIHMDAISDIIQALTAAVKNAFSALSRVTGIGNSIDNYNHTRWNGFVKEATGVNMEIYTPAASKYVQEWIDLNTAYLSDLPKEYIQKINQIVSAGIENGISKTVIAAQINEAGKKFRGVFSGDQKRAERIARDQVGKLNSTLSRARMRQSKVDVYKWSTSIDERVRGNPSGLYPKSRYSHYLMEGKFKQVDNASKISDNGIDWRNVRGREEPRHAGQAINCRCTMIPSFIKIKQVVDEDIQRAA